MRLAVSLPCLRHLVHRNWPVLQQPHLEYMLQHCSRLQLLETSWRPAAAPHTAGSSTAGASGIAAAWWDGQQERHRFEAEQAFCQVWRLRLQHRWKKMCSGVCMAGCLAGCICAAGTPGSLLVATDPPNACRL